MTQAEFDQLKMTFPWTEQRMVVQGQGGLVRVVNNRGEEVPIFTMTQFLMMITRRLTPGQKEESSNG